MNFAYPAGRSTIPQAPVAVGQANDNQGYETAATFSPPPEILVFREVDDGEGAGLEHDMAASAMGGGIMISSASLQHEELTWFENTSYMYYEDPAGDAGLAATATLLYANADAGTTAQAAAAYAAVGAIDRQRYQNIRRSFPDPNGDLDDPYLDEFQDGRHGSNTNNRLGFLSLYHQLPSTETAASAVSSRRLLILVAILLGIFVTSLAVAMIAASQLTKSHSTTKSAGPSPPQSGNGQQNGTNSTISTVAPSEAAPVPTTPQPTPTPRDPTLVPESPTTPPHLMPTLATVSPTQNVPTRASRSMAPSTKMPSDSKDRKTASPANSPTSATRSLAPALSVAARSPTFQPSWKESVAPTPVRVGGQHGPVVAKHTAAPSSRSPTPIPTHWDLAATARVVLPSAPTPIPTNKAVPAHATDVFPTTAPTTIGIAMGASGSYTAQPTSPPITQDRHSVANPTAGPTKRLLRPTLMNPSTDAPIIVPTSMPTWESRQNGRAAEPSNAFGQVNLESTHADPTLSPTWLLPPTTQEPTTMAPTMTPTSTPTGEPRQNGRAAEPSSSFEQIDLDSSNADPTIGPTTGLLRPTLTRPTTPKPTTVAPAVMILVPTSTPTWVPRENGRAAEPSYPFGHVGLDGNSANPTVGPTTWQILPTSMSPTTQEPSTVATTMVLVPTLTPTWLPRGNGRPAAPGLDGNSANPTVGPTIGVLAPSSMSPTTQEPTTIATTMVLVPTSTPTWVPRENGRAAEPSFPHEPTGGDGNGDNTPYPTSPGSDRSWPGTVNGGTTRPTGGNSNDDNCDQSIAGESQILDTEDHSHGNRNHHASDSGHAITPLMFEDQERDRNRNSHDGPNAVVNTTTAIEPRSTQPLQQALHSYGP